MPDADVILAVKNLRTLVGGAKGLLRSKHSAVPAVDGVDLAVREGEMLGIVGESGSGKTTLGRTILGIQREASGEIILRGRVVSGVTPRKARFMRSDIQYVHQDAAASLDPWWSIGKTLRETLIIRGLTARRDRAQRIDEVLAAVGLDSAAQQRYPHELSGGQLKRVTLARILLLDPKIVILDEPTAGLDLSVQATVLKMIMDQHQKYNITNLLITHDLSVVKRVCTSVAIMYLGRIVEVANAKEFFQRPSHPYSRVLLSASPRIDTVQKLEGAEVMGEPPSFAAIPSGCRFHTRCAFATDLCVSQDPLLEEVAAGHQVACHYRHELAHMGQASSHADKVISKLSPSLLHCKLPSS